MPAQDFFESIKSDTGEELLFPSELIFKNVAQQFSWRYGEFLGNGDRLIINKVEIAFLKASELLLACPLCRGSKRFRL